MLKSTHWRQVPLRRRLLLLAVASILPLAFISGLGLVALVRQQQAAAEQSALELARVLATAVDTEVGRSMAVLEAMTASALLDADDMKGYQGLARRIIAPRSDWRAVIVADDQGRVVAHTSVAAPPYPALVDAPSHANVVATGRPQVGVLRRGPRGEWGIALRMPAMRDGRVRYVLTAVLNPDVIAELLRANVSKGGIVSVFDTTGQRIARSLDHATTVGLPATPSLARLMEGAASAGVGRTRVVEGDDVYTAYVRMPETGWTVAVGLPAAGVEAGANRALALYGGGLLASLLLAVGLAFFVARGINRPIRQLRRAAQALGEGELPRRPMTSIHEVQDVADALVASAERIARAEALREEALQSERTARGAEQAARQRFEILAQAGSRLPVLLDPEAALRAVAELVVPAIADLIRVDLLDADGELHRVLSHHADPERAARLRQLPARTRRSAGPGTLSWSAQTGSVDHVRMDDAKALDGLDPELVQGLHGLGICEYVVMPLRARGRTIGAMGVAQAQSGRVLGEPDRALLLELAHRAAVALDTARMYVEAEQARAQAEQANGTKDEFLAMLGHELRNPLAPIVTTLALMERQAQGVMERERRIVERQVTHLVRLVDDLLDASRIARGKVTLHRARIELTDVVTRAIAHLEPEARPGTGRIRLTGPGEPVWVWGDEVRLTQVVVNLIGNGLKFAPPPTPVEVRLEVAGDAAVLEVVDHGVGIEAALLPRIFEPFVQQEQPIDRRAGGLGLGLAIARSLVELHGGRIEARSGGRGDGSCFLVHLPLHADDPAAAPAHVAAPDTPGLARRLVVVDDNADAAETLAALLECEGHEVLVAGNGADALALMPAYLPALALMDIGLPDMDGFALARAVRRDGQLQHMKLVALTGYGREEDRRRALAAGFDEHLAKPVGAETLLQTVQRLLAGSGEAGPPQREG